MARPSSNDPLDKFRWSVDILGFTRLGFTACDVPSLAINTKSYAEGGAHLHPKKIIDSVEYRPVTFARGVTKDESFNSWAKQFMELVKGSLDQALAGSSASNLTADEQAALDYRRDVTITHLNRAGNPIKVYTLYNAIPVGYEPASQFSADADDLLSIERLTLAYEGFDVQSIAKDSNPFDTRDVFKRLTRSIF